LFFSATIPKIIKDLASTILHCPENVTVHTASSTTDNITQKSHLVTRNYKRQLLQQTIKRQDLDSIIVFVNTKDESERVFEFVKTA